mmetsp:Transcript_71738/g.214179  ORF Transcript_71738/g.214179 Transcript_71738/m.214179 type:complete len:421 (+) Transcript_71738:583-1845(+)
MLGKLARELQQLRQPEDHHRHVEGVCAARRRGQASGDDARLLPAQQRCVERLAERLGGGACARERGQQPSVGALVLLSDAVQHPARPTAPAPLGSGVLHVAHRRGPRKGEELGLPHREEGPHHLHADHDAPHRHAVDVKDVALSELGQAVLVRVVLVVRHQSRAALSTDPEVHEAALVHAEAELLRLLLVPLPRDAGPQGAVRPPDLEPVREQVHPEAAAGPPDPALLVGGVAAVGVAEMEGAPAEPLRGRQLAVQELEQAAGHHAVHAAREAEHHPARLAQQTQLLQGAPEDPHQRVALKAPARGRVEKAGEEGRLHAPHGERRLRACRRSLLPTASIQDLQPGEVAIRRPSQHQGLVGRERVEQVPLDLDGLDRIPRLDEEPLAQLQGRRGVVSRSAGDLRGDGQEHAEGQVDEVRLP